MSYEQHTWVTSELITADKLNNMESGITTANTRAMTPGPQGEQGPAGTNATITGATATVDNTSSDSPTCQVTAGGTESARSFTFAFTGIKGAKGDQGANGAKGDTGDTGPAGEAATISNITVTVDNTTSASPSCQVTPGGTAQDRTFTFAFTGIKGAKGDQGNQGPAGADGAQGEQGPAGTPGQGVPTGGTAGQILSKVDGTNYNTQWINAPTTPTASQLLTGTPTTVTALDTGAELTVAVAKINEIITQLQARGVIS